MAAALGTNTVFSATKPKRLEGHTSNVEQPILYVQYIKSTLGETTESGDTYIIPHKFTSVKHINVTPLSSTGLTTHAAFYLADSAIISGPTQITTAATAGASTVVLTGLTASANDTYNYAWLEITHASGNKQVVQITDFVTSSGLATLADPLTEDIGTTGTYYTIRGTLLTTTGAAATPRLSYEVVGTFE